MLAASKSVVVGLLCALFARDEAEAMAGPLLARGASAEEVHSCVRQAAYLLAGSGTDASRIRLSLVGQSAYFAQPFAVAYEDAHVLICEKPFDTQIAHGPTQTPRYDGERTLVGQ